MLRTSDGHVPCPRCQGSDAQCELCNGGGFVATASTLQTFVAAKVPKMVAGVAALGVVYVATANAYDEGTPLGAKLIPITLGVSAPATTTVTYSTSYVYSQLMPNMRADEPIRLVHVGHDGYSLGPCSVPAGSCCVKQCSVPSPQTRSTA